MYVPRLVLLEGSNIIIIKTKSARESAARGRARAGRSVQVLKAKHPLPCHVAIPAGCLKAGYRLEQVKVLPCRVFVAQQPPRSKPSRSLITQLYAHNTCREHFQGSVGGRAQDAHDDDMVQLKA